MCKVLVLSEDDAVVLGALHSRPDIQPVHSGEMYLTCSFRGHRTGLSSKKQEVVSTEPFRLRLRECSRSPMRDGALSIQPSLVISQ